MTGLGDWDVHWDMERRKVEARWRQDLELETGGKTEKEQSKEETRLR